MLARITPVAAIAALLLLLVACQDSPEKASRSPVPTPAATPSPYTGYLTEEIPPCTPIAGSSKDLCEPAGPIEMFGAAGGINPAYDTEAPLSIRQFLDGSSLPFIPHIVLRGTYIPDTVRCTSGDPYRPVSYETPDYFQHSILINCYADVRVNGYVLGNGPAQLTVLVAFHHYWHGYYAEWAAEENTTEQEVVEILRNAHEIILEEGFERPGHGIYGREVILFVGPGHSHTHEVWEVFATWYVQLEEDGTVVVVHPHRDDWKGARPDKYREHQSKLEFDLPRFKKEVLAANQDRVTEYGGRITSVDDPYIAEGGALPLLISEIQSLDEFLVSTGAYDHPDGTPVPPPPVPGEGDPVTNIGVDDSTPGASPIPPGGIVDSPSAPAAEPPAPGIVIASLADGTFTISWDAVEGAARYKAQSRKSGSDEEWADVETTETTSSTFSPVGGPDCGSTYEFRALLYGDGTTYAADWSEPSDPASVPTGACNRSPEFGAASYSFSIAEDAATGSSVGSVIATDPDEGDTVSYSITAGDEDGHFAIDAGTGAITVAGALDYETASLYTLTVQAGDGNDGSATAAVIITVTEVGEENTTPFFEVSSYYSFSVPEDAASGATVGAVSATELDEGDTVSYSITVGNDAGHFTIDADTGAITVAGALDYETASSYTLTVVASDGTGGSATAWVTVTVTDVDENSAP